ncbi:RidA family protein [Vineibacter terrae]|uniref:RidA family protein n=1 Tax=Vineibacter terrae TaxID=2586908 RepID=UPI002E318199|nr:RidA family protein [Vineibacter terrae]HEX2891576.1 RidA family protein [Vineibacter terrae]
MGKRRSIDVEGFSHGTNPIPAACRVGNIVMTGGVSGLDPATQMIPPDAAEQCRLMFANLRRILEAAGTSPDDVVKVTVWIRNQKVREAINPQWLAMFPDAASRPARHTLLNENLAGSLLIQCDAMAVITAG